MDLQTETTKEPSGLPFKPSKTPKGSPGPALPKYPTKREAVLCGLVGGDKPIYFLGGVLSQALGDGRITKF